jgi:hypothetical protein
LGCLAEHVELLQLISEQVFLVWSFFALISEFTVTALVKLAGKGDIRGVAGLASLQSALHFQFLSSSEIWV